MNRERLIELADEADEFVNPTSEKYLTDFIPQFFDKYIELILKDLYE